MKENFTWSDCWVEVQQLRRDMHRLMNRMRDLAPARGVIETNLAKIAEMAMNFSADVTGVSLIEIRKKCRKNDVAWARHVAMTVTREFSGASLKEVTRAFGHFDHNTVIYALKKVRSEPIKKYLDQVEEVRSMMRGALLIEPLPTPGKRERISKLKKIREEKL